MFLVDPVPGSVTIFSPKHTTGMLGIDRQRKTTTIIITIITIITIIIIIKITIIMSKRTKGNKKKSTRTPPSPRWTDELDFINVLPTNNGNYDSDAATINIRIISWNILAESYLNRKSQRGLPVQYQEEAFTPKKRRLQIAKALQQFIALHVDIFCLQEVDLQEEIRQHLQDFYVGVATPTLRGGGAGGRVDACCIYYHKEHWKRIDHQVLRLDDLATLGSTATSIDSNLQGLQQSFLRRNAAIFIKLQHRTTGKYIVIVNAHLFWNPHYEYIKLCQAHYITTQAHAFSNGIPVVICGDFNSQPKSCVHTYLTTGTVNATQIAPWNPCTWNSDEPIITHSDTTSDIVDPAVQQLEHLHLGQKKPSIRYLCDYTLNRFTRWLRILGIDCALETMEEEIMRTKNDNNQLFHRCRTEQRTLVTTSTKMILRRDCPASTYLISPRSLNDLEHCFVHMLLTHGVTITPKDFLSICVVCNGMICNVLDYTSKRNILVANQAPEHLSDELEVFACNGCGQGYWWCDQPTSSASRVKNQATRLLELCLRGGVPLQGELHMFDFINIEKERATKLPFELERLDCVDWLKDRELTNPLDLESAYALRDNGVVVGESIAFSNVTQSFVGLLDYVLFDPRQLRRTGQLYVPKSFHEMNPRDIQNGHLLPSNVWPSDHLAVGAQLTMEIGLQSV